MVDSETSDTDELESSYDKLLNDLFKRALTRRTFDAVCTLLRVDGMSDANWDPFEEARIALDDFNWLLAKAIEDRSEKCQRRVGLLMYCQAVEMTAPHDILVNLLRCVADKPFHAVPFHHLGRRRKKRLFDYVPPSAKVKFAHIKNEAIAAGEAGLAEAIESFFDEDIRNAFSHSDYILTDDYFRYTKGGLARQIDVDELDDLINRCFAFYGAFLGLHRFWLKHLGSLPRYHKGPNYEVLELLTDNENIVYGFQMHFSNGSKSTFSRQESGTQAVNMMFGKDGELQFMCGRADKMERVWKVDGKVFED